MPKNQLVLSHQPQASPFSDYLLEKEKHKKIESLLYRIAPRSHSDLQNEVAGVRSEARRVPQYRFDTNPGQIKKLAVHEDQILEDESKKEG